MPQRDKIRARWDDNDTDSENEDSTSYNIPSRDIPSSKTSLRSLVSASTTMRGPRRCSFSCISNHLQRMSLATRKVITIFPLLGKNNIVVLMWFVLRQGMEKAMLTRNRTKILKLSWRHFCGATLLPIGIYSNPWLSINNYNSCFWQYT